MYGTVAYTSVNSNNKVECNYMYNCSHTTAGVTIHEFISNHEEKWLCHIWFCWDVKFSSPINLPEAMLVENGEYNESLNIFNIFVLCWSSFTLRIHPCVVILLFDPFYFQLWCLLFFLCVSLSGTFFHVDQALWPAGLSFCSWSTTKQVSMSVLCKATSCHLLYLPFIWPLSHSASS